MKTTKDYTNALLNFNTLVYSELTFKTKEDFNAIINTFIKKNDALDIQKVLSNIIVDNEIYSPAKVADTLIDKENLTLTYVTNWAPHIEISEVIANACKHPVYYRYRDESMVTDHVGEYLFKDNKKEGYKQECNYYIKEMSKDSLAVALYFRTYLGEDLSFTEINKDCVAIDYAGELGKSVLEFNHTTTLMEKFNNL